MVAVNETPAENKKPRTVAQDLHELGGIAREMVEEKAGQLRSSAANCAVEGRERARQVEQSIEQYIRDKPLKSMLIAAGVGLVLGRFWMRR